MTALGRRITGVCCILAVLAAPGAQGSTANSAPRHLTVDAAVSAPFSSGLVSSREGDKLAWVYEYNGARNIWVASPDRTHGGGSRALTTYTGDDGIDLADLSWAASGETLVFTRGGTIDGSGANPSSSPAGGSGQEIWVVAAAGGAPRRIGSGHSPAPSPTRDEVAFIANEQIWLAPLADDGHAAQLIHDQGRSSAISWSPDGQRFAFISARSDHSFIGVYDLASRTIVWLAPSTDTDSSPAWSPDGRHVAFLRAPAGWDQTRYEHRTDQPWSVWVADPETGEGAAVWTADTGIGSAFHPVADEPNLLWGADQRLIFFYERTGWRHLYSITASGKGLVELTPGNFEVFSVVPSRDLRTLFYSSNQDDLDRRHIWSVNVGSGPPRRFGKGTGIEDSPQAGRDGRVFALHGDARNPLRPVSLGLDGSSGDVLESKELAQFPADKLVEPQPVIFQAADGLTLHGQLFLPPHKRAGRAPAIIYCHGGPERQMLLGWHPMHPYSYMYAMNQHLASTGYVVLSVNYRGGEGYGLDFREAAHVGPLGASELNDIIGAARFLDARADVDPKRLGLWGGSYGGLLTALGLARAPELFAVGVDYAGIHDWRSFAAFFGITGLPPEALQAMHASSVVSTLDKWKAPVLLVHADDDHTVPFSQTVELVQGLRKHGVGVQQLVLPNENHELMRKESWMHFLHATDDFLGAHLGPVEDGR